MPSLATAMDRLIGDRLLDECDADERIVRRTLATAWVGVSTITPVWGILYIALGEVGPGLIPLIYGLATLPSLVLLRQFGRWEWFRVTQLIQHLLLPFFLMWAQISS